MNLVSAGAVWAFRLQLNGNSAHLERLFWGETYFSELAPTRFIFPVSSEDTVDKVGLTDVRLLAAWTCAPGVWLMVVVVWVFLAYCVVRF